MSNQPEGVNPKEIPKVVATEMTEAEQIAYTGAEALPDIIFHEESEPLEVVPKIKLPDSSSKPIEKGRVPSRNTFYQEGDSGNKQESKVVNKPEVAGGSVEQNSQQVNLEEAGDLQTPQFDKIENPGTPSFRAEEKPLDLEKRGKTAMSEEDQKKLADHIEILDAFQRVVDNRKIKFKDLPLIWQEHVLKRRAEGFLPASQDTFTRKEIVEAAADPTSYTDPHIIDKVFNRAELMKIPFDVLPQKWQEILKPIYQKEIETFGNVTVQELVDNGATDEDISTLQKLAGEKTIADLKADLTQPIETLNAKPLAEKIIAEKRVEAKRPWYRKVAGYFGF